MAIALVRLVLRIYPVAFRRQFARAMEQDFREDLEERAALGTGRVAALVTRTVVDLTLSALREWLTPTADRGRPQATPARSLGRVRILDDLRLDVRLAIRSLFVRPGFLAVAVTTLALGIGANTAIFSAVNTLLLRPLPYGDEERLVAVWEESRARDIMLGTTAPANYLDWRAGVAAFQDAAAYGGGVVTLGGEGLSEVLTGAWVTGNFFDVLDVRPILGRAFRDEETWSGTTSAIILSERVWARRFGRDPAVLGSTIMLDETQREVVGIAPVGFDFPERGVDVWQPLAWDPTSPGQTWFRAERFLRVVARLEADATLEQADAELQSVVAGLQDQYPATNRGAGAALAPLRDSLVADAREPLLILFGATALLLLLTCANVANLLLLRASDRNREVALRAALGAGRGRLVRQMLTESLVLALLGAAMGLGVGVLGIRVLTALQPPTGWRIAEIPIDLPVLAFVLVVSAGCSVLFGLAPALRGAATNATAGLREGLLASQNKSRQTMGRFIVVAEVALALLLVTGSGLLLRSFVALRAVDPGFATEDRLAAWVVLPVRYESNADILTFVDEVVARLGRLGGVREVTYTTRLPFEGTNARSAGISVEGRGPVQLSSGVGGRLVGPNYFRVLGVPLLRGRPFDEADDERSEPVVVINQEAWRRIFADEDPIGQRIAWDEGSPGVTTWYRVVGVVGDEHQNGLHERPPMEAFIPFRRLPPTRINFVLHAPGLAVDDVREAVRAEIAAVDPLLPLSRFVALDDTYAAALGRDRFLLTLIATFGALALLLAVVGVYGVVAETTRKRTHEIGIRVALGAGPFAIGGRVLRTGLALTAAGIAIGVPVALAGARLLGSVLFGVLPHDPVTFMVAPFVLALAAVLACLIPTLRAVRLDPVVALRDSR